MSFLLQAKRWSLPVACAFWSLRDEGLPVQLLLCLVVRICRLFLDVRKRRMIGLLSLLDHFIDFCALVPGFILLLLELKCIELPELRHLTRQHYDLHLLGSHDGSSMCLLLLLQL